MLENNKFNIKKNTDIIVAFAVLGIVLMIIVPLPSTLLDILLAFNITLSAVVLMITMFTTNVLQLSVFPTLITCYNIT